MTYESLLKLAREGKTIWVKVKGYNFVHQVTAFSNMEYCVGGAYFKYESDIYELLTRSPT